MPSGQNTQQQISPNMPDNPFVYQAPNDYQVEVIIRMRDWMRQLYDHLLEELPESRERSLAITKLEECSMWVNKCVAFRLSEGKPNAIGSSD